MEDLRYWNYLKPLSMETIRWSCRPDRPASPAAEVFTLEYDLLCPVQLPHYSGASTRFFLHRGWNPCDFLIFTEWYGLLIEIGRVLKGVTPSAFLWFAEIWVYVQHVPTAFVPWFPKVSICLRALCECGILLWWHVPQAHQPVSICEP